jgi:hypothetical protein
VGGLPYITSSYYKDEYKGIPMDDTLELDRYILRASEVIDKLTAYRIAKGEVNLETSHPFIKTQVEKATAAMTEYYVENGYSTNQSTAQSVGLGSFNYSLKASNGETMDVPNNVVSHLTPTGLLYAGINVSGGGVYYDD